MLKPTNVGYHVNKNRFVLHSLTGPYCYRYCYYTSTTTTTKTYICLMQTKF